MEECDGDVLAWSCLMIHVVTEWGSNAWEWADRLLKRLNISESTQGRLGSEFVPIPEAVVG
jgi:hypothetical protein